jgi:hypothetical protein
MSKVIPLKSTNWPSDPVESLDHETNESDIRHFRTPAYGEVDVSAHCRACIHYDLQLIDASTYLHISGRVGFTVVAIALSATVVFNTITGPWYPIR